MRLAGGAMDAGENSRGSLDVYYGMAAALLSQQPSVLRFQTAVAPISHAFRLLL